jgi:hypothetical protein
MAPCWHCRAWRGPTASERKSDGQVQTERAYALKKLREQREELDAQEARLRDEAAGELGKVLLECGAETIEPAQLKQLVRASLAIGIDETLKRLSPA